VSGVLLLAQMFAVRLDCEVMFFLQIVGKVRLSQDSDGAFREGRTIGSPKQLAPVIS